MHGQRWQLALGLQTSLVQASWTAVRLMIGYRALEFGADPFFLGLLAASFALPALIGGLPAGRLSDRAGGPVVALAGLLIATVGTVGAIALPGRWTLLAAAGVIGLGQIIIMIGQQTFVANVSKAGDTDAAFGTLTAAASIGQLVGPPLMTATASAFVVAGGADPNTDAGLFGCAALVLLGTPSYWWLRRHHRAHTPPETANGPGPERVSALVKTPQMWRSLTVSGAVLVSVDLLYAFVPVWATDRGVSPAAVGLLLALRAAVTVLSRIGLSRLVERLGRKLLITGSVVAASAGLIAFPFVDLAGAIAVMIALGVGLGIPQPLTMAWVTALVPAESHGTALGMRLTSNRLAQLTVPVGVGALAGPFGLAGIFWGSAAVLIGAAGVMLHAHPGGARDPAS